MTDIRQRIIEKATASDGFPEASVTAALKGAREMAILIRERIVASRDPFADTYDGNCQAEAIVDDLLASLVSGEKDD